MTPALLFDLDETLVVEPAAVAAFEATARHATSTHDIDARKLAAAARSRARELWRAAPTYPYCRRVGISSWEGLWCRYEGDGPETGRLREWSPTHRREAWRLALADQDVAEIALASELGERFAAERRARHQVFADVTPTLRELTGSHSIAVVTNGASCLQREKLSASGLADLIPIVVVSEDLGTAKPDPAVFQAAVAKLDVDSDAVMIGDSIEKDINGALGAGLRAVRVNRGKRPRPDALPRDVPTVTSLTELPRALAGLGCAAAGPLHPAGTAAEPKTVSRNMSRTAQF